MADSRPLVSIGMPVYNGERFIREALDSLLAQDYENFELIISDNASIDGTQEICLEYAGRDKRIRYIRNEENTGAIKNFNYVFRLSEGEFFMWAASDDRWHSRFISRCLETIRSDSSIVLVYPQAVLIDVKGRSYGIMPGRLDTRDYDPVSRFNLAMWGYIYGNHIYGLIRAEALAKTRLFQSMFSPDRILLAELSLLGAFAHIPEPLFFRRRLGKDEDMRQRHKRWLEDIDPTNRGKHIFFPGVRLFYEYIRVAAHAPLPRSKRVALIAALFTGFLAKHGKGWIKPLIIRRWE